MKKIIYLIISIILLINISACSGYKPIFGSQNLQFEIADYSIIGNKNIGNQIYSKLYGLSNANKNNPDAQSIHIIIDVTKEKKATVKNSAGKTLKYKISLNSTIIVKDFLTETEILNYNFSPFSSYEVQDQYSDTVKLENSTVENLVSQIFQNLLIKLLEKISNK